MTESLPENHLFDFTKVAAFPPKNLDDLTEDDPLWELSAARRRDALYSEPDKTSGDWLVLHAAYLFDIGNYVETFEPSNRARRIAEETGDDVLLARAYLSHIRSEINLGAVEEAATHLEHLREVAEGAKNDFVHGVHFFLQALYKIRAGGTAIDNLEQQIGLFREAAARFDSFGDVDLTILATIEAADAVARKGVYIPSIREVQGAMELATERGAWKYTGRLLLLASSAAADQGYRLHVEETTQKGIRWCQFVGDFWGRVNGVFALGRLISYQIPSNDPSLLARPERYLLEALEEAKLHSTEFLVVQIENWFDWLYKKCGLEPERARNLRGTAWTERGDAHRARVDDLVQQTSMVMRTIDLRISARLQDGVEDSPDAFLVLDARRGEDGTCADFINEYRNAVGVRLFGIGPGKVIMFSEVRNHPLFEGLAPGLIAAVDHRKTFEDVRDIEQDGEPRWYRRRLVPSGDGAVLTLRDVTAERRSQEALRHAAQIAERSVRVQSEFLANMSHEIRTPINGVLGLARMLADAPLEPPYRSYVEDIIGSGDILLRVIGNVLDLSKIESDSLVLDPAPVSLRELVASTVRLYQGQASEKKLKLTFEIDPSAPKIVTTDGPRLRQVLANLIANAVKFTAEGAVEVLVSSQHNDVVIEVCDSGIGIPPERIGVVFERYEQITPDSRMLGGSGLGLALSRGIVDLMGGSIQVSSTPGEGSRFIVSLPLKADVLPESPACQMAQAPYVGSKVLLVDDNRVNLIVSTHALTRLGCDVTVANDGQQALDELESRTFDIVFMDIRMPILDGLETTRRLRQMEAKLGRHTPVAALTAGALVEERDECFAAGMDDYVTKPFSDETLRAVLLRWL